MPSFDPDAAAKPGAGIFGLPFTRDESRIILLPVPFDATTSYGGGASGGAEAIREASAQVDLHDFQFGDVYRAGIFMEESPEHISELSRRARAHAQPIIAKGGAEQGDEVTLSKVDSAGEQVNLHVYNAAASVLAEAREGGAGGVGGEIPGLVGGDHSTPFGIIRACAEHVTAKSGNGGAGMGILHLDAHMDLREAFEGFTWSHASIMYNVMKRIPAVTKLVQIGLRDVGTQELAFAANSGGRIHAHHDLDWSRRMLDGERFTDLVKNAIEPLPPHVYVSFDIDGLDPSMCPHTGTPVPGGLSFAQASIVIELLAKSGRSIVGFDLVEVSPGDGDEGGGGGGGEWDANVGARILYKLCGAAVHTSSPR
ncbi:MAG: arginase family protein [Phycisphaerales bacterium]|nr:arginase family protein [Phycisphaerales bacterium]